MNNDSWIFSLLDVIWIVLNIILFIAFLYIFVKSLKMIYREMKIVATVIFMLGVLPFFYANDAKNNSFANGSYSVKFYDKVIPVNTLQKIYLVVKVDTFTRQVSHQSQLIGSMGCICWRETHMSIQPDSSLLKYHLRGCKDYYLLGIHIYSEVKEYAGIFQY
jgi:hypothetical protein